MASKPSPLARPIQAAIIAVFPICLSFERLLTAQLPPSQVGADLRPRQSVNPEGIPAEDWSPRPIPAGTPLDSCNPVARTGGSVVVYDNQGPNTEFFNPGVGAFLADDLLLAGSLRQLDRIRQVCVFSPGPSLYSVTISLWTNDPNMCRPLAPIPNASCTASNLVPGTVRDAAALAQSPTACNFGPNSGIILPNQLWVVLTFSTNEAGWVTAYAAETGFTADLVYYDPAGPTPGVCGDYVAAYAGHCVEIHVAKASVGACCDDASGDCDEGVTGDACKDAGRRYGGDGSTCAAIDPPCTAPEACCLPSGSCNLLPPNSCVGAGGNPLGAATTCGPLEACCFSDGTCANLDPRCCQLQNGLALGAGTVCRGDPDGNSVDNACEPPPDRWNTCSDGSPDQNYFDLSLPAGFFGPGCAPFVGRVEFFGVPLDPNTLGNTDTLLQRGADPVQPSDPSGTQGTIHVRIVSLQLVSTQPITIPCNGTDQDWSVAVGLSNTPAPLGSLTATKTHANGGTYDSTFYVQPLFTFSRVGGTIGCGVCQLYGDVYPELPDCIVEIGDLLCVLDGYSDLGLCPGGDIAPCGGDGIIELSDVLADLDAYAGIYLCPHPCPQGACELPNGDCTDVTCPIGGLTETDCALVGGTWLGDQTLCPPPPECFPGPPREILFDSAGTLPPTEFTETDVPFVHTVSATLDDVVVDPAANFVPGIRETVPGNLISQVKETVVRLAAAAGLTDCISGCYVDLDIDSNNNDGINPPSRGFFEEIFENFPPSKYICLNDDDDDNNQVRDLSEEPIRPTPPENDCVPMVLELRPNTAPGKWRLNYNAKVQVYNVDVMPFVLIPSGMVFPCPLMPNPKTVRVEGVEVSAMSGDAVMTLEYDCDGDNVFERNDRVLATVFKVEITDENDVVLDGSENTTVAKLHKYRAKLTPAGAGVTAYQWTINGTATPPVTVAIHSYALNHPTHKDTAGSVVPTLLAGKLETQQIEVHWTTQVGHADLPNKPKLKITATFNGGGTCAREIEVNPQHDPDPNKNIYSIKEGTVPAGGPNLTPPIDHGEWHHGPIPGVGGAFYDTGRDGPNYRGAKFFRWHYNILKLYLDWRVLFHYSVPIDPTLGPDRAVNYKYLTVLGGDQPSDVYQYVRLGEYPNMLEEPVPDSSDTPLLTVISRGLEHLGDDIHPWHDDGHNSPALPGITDAYTNVAAANQMFWNWHKEIDDFRRTLAPDQAAASGPNSTVPADGATDVPSGDTIMVTFDLPVSINGLVTPGDPKKSNLAQLLPAAVTIRRTDTNQTATNPTITTANYKTHTITFPATNEVIPFVAGKNYQVTITGTSPGYNEKVFSFTVAGPLESSRDYAQYLENEFAGNRPFVQEAERRARQGIISSRLAQFEKTKEALFVFSLVQEQLPPEEVAPVYADLLRQPDPQVRSAALYGLSLCGSAALPFLVRIIECYEDQEDEVSWRAVAAIASLGEGAQPAVRPLMERLQRVDDTRRQRRAAVVALGRIGPPASEAIPLLEGELENSESATALEAFRAIGAIRNEPALDASFAARGSDVFLGRDGFRAFQSLREGRLASGDAVEVLDALLRLEPPAPVAILALELMGSFSSGSPDIIELLLDWIASPDDLVAQSATAALAKSPMTDAGAMEFLVRELNASQARKASAAATALARFGPKASPFVPAVMDVLRECTGETDYELVGAYLDILRAIGSDAAIAAPLLASLLPEDSPIYDGRSPHFAKSIRKYLLVTLADVGITSQAIPAIVDLLANSGQAVMIAAGARAAGALRAKQEMVIPYLLKVLELDDLAIGTSLDGIATRVLRPGPHLTSAYLEAIRALARMGPAAKEAVPVLRWRAQDPANPSPFYPRYQEEAAQAAAVISGE